VEVTIEYLDTLPPERSGKFRHVISEVPMNLEAGSTQAEAAASRAS
jgi:hypothetical protein